VVRTPVRNYALKKVARNTAEFGDTRVTAQVQPAGGQDITSDNGREFAGHRNWAQAQAMFR
jgi:IS30 family transposase